MTHLQVPHGIREIMGSKQQNTAAPDAMQNMPMITYTANMKFRINEFKIGKWINLFDILNWLMIEWTSSSKKSNTLLWEKNYLFSLWFPFFGHIHTISSLGGLSHTFFQTVIFHFYILYCSSFLLIFLSLPISVPLLLILSPTTWDRSGAYIPQLTHTHIQLMSSILK